MRAGATLRFCSGRGRRGFPSQNAGSGPVLRLPHPHVKHFPHGSRLTLTGWLPAAAVAPSLAYQKRRDCPEDATLFCSLSSPHQSSARPHSSAAPSSSLLLLRHSSCLRLGSGCPHPPLLHLSPPLSFTIRREFGADVYVDPRLSCLMRLTKRHGAPPTSPDPTAKRP